MPKPDFATARAKAEAEARESWEQFAPKGVTTYLQDFCTESEHCWVFYRHPQIVLPPEQGLRDWAIGITGAEHEVWSLYDLSAQPDLAQKYADVMSRHFAGEKVKQAEIQTVSDEYQRRKGEQ